MFASVGSDLTTLRASAARLAVMAGPPPPPRSAIAALRGEKTAEQPFPWQEHEELSVELRHARGDAGWLESAAGRLQQRAEALSATIASSSGACGACAKALATPAQIRRAKVPAASVQPGFGAGKHVFFVNGRPVMILKLTHELATDEEQVPYLASVLSPAPVLEVFGRAADCEPQVARRRAVWWGWQNALLPLTLSPQLPPDTLFLVFEGDFRFSKEHSVVCAAHEEAAAPTGWSGPPARTNRGAAPPSSEGASSASVQPRGRGRGAGKGKGSPVLPWHMRLTPQTPPAHEQLNNRLLQATVGLVTHAAQQDHGNLVWLAWDLKTSKEAPAAGTTLVAVAKRAAAQLLLLMKAETHPRHFDNWLADGLKTGGSQEWQELRASSCYLWNPVGGYQAHVSGCEKNLLRTEAWDKWQPWPEVLPGGSER